MCACRVRVHVLVHVHVHVCLFGSVKCGVVGRLSWIHAIVFGFLRRWLLFGRMCICSVRNTVPVLFCRAGPLINMFYSFLLGALVPRPGPASFETNILFRLLRHAERSVQGEPAQVCCLCLENAYYFF